MQIFKTSLVNPSRRDLIKQLVAMGALGASALLHPASVYGRNSKNAASRLTAKSTWKEDDQYEALRRALLWRVNTPERYPDVIVQANT